ncbi:D-alanyl-D-alanine carboxypeptidase [Corynebacterium matruchotii]|uniref:D-alanyl-D-alanine carboxypeptidase/D-alanyl-D-alanine-endopeptidase n=1 Tax=Corynebacterium matruchotii TaxID=43768 RepID=UPI0028E61F7F|nr:D-alanyl-D-alanine carboxypeptidase [Corynebacterium matruchotii]
MKNAKWWVATAVATVAVVATAVTGVIVTDKNRLYYDPAPQLVDAKPVAFPLKKPDGEPNLANLAPMLDDARLGKASIQFRDVTTGNVVLAKNPQLPLLPASSTKVLTVSAALLKLNLDDRITTRVVQSGSDIAVIKAAGDVWMTYETIKDLAEQIRKNLPGVKQVQIDTSAWTAPSFIESWGRENITEGFIAPMEPAMIYGARLNGARSGDVPRSNTPALDVAGAVARELGVTAFSKAEGTVPAGEGVKELAKVESPTLRERIEKLMETSDNVMAEAVGRELSGSDPVSETLRILGEHFQIPADLKIFDNSGMSKANRIPAEFLDSLMFAAAKDNSRLSAILATLPVAAGTGTLESRYTTLRGRGYVRAKTGTLTDTSALVGTILSESGRVYTFAIISNDAPILEARSAMDELASAVRSS